MRAHDMCRVRAWYAHVHAPCFTDYTDGLMLFETKPSVLCSCVRVCGRNMLAHVLVLLLPPLPPLSSNQWRMTAVT